VLQTSSAAGSATPPLAGPITDFCAPLKVNISMPGVTQDNPDIPGNEGGVPLLTLPDAGTQVTTIGYYLSQRDADGDGYENSLDSCPLNADTVWDPRALQPQPADNDAFAGQPSGDGISDTCDPSPTDATPAAGGQPTDYDGDGYPSRGDNCPLVANGKNEADNQGDHDKNAAGEEVGDGIGDACDPNAGSPDGAEILCVRLSTITVGGPTTAATSPCLTELPPPGTTAQDVGGSAEGGAAGGAAAGGGTAAGRGSAGGGAAGGAGGPASGVGSLSPVGGSVPAWAAIAAALGAAGVIGSAGTMASRLIRRRRNS